MACTIALLAAFGSVFGLTAGQFSGVAVRVSSNGSAPAAPELLAADPDNPNTGLRPTAPWANAIGI